MTWGIGANDVANAMGPAVGSGAITMTGALVIAGVFELAGAIIAGGEVTSTVRSNIVSVDAFVDQPGQLALGMLAALLSAGIWLLIASAWGWPISTTHSIVGSIIGFALVAAGASAVNWGKVTEIAASWVISPLIGGAIAFALQLSIRHLILKTSQPVAAARRWGPLYVFLVGFIVSLITLFKGLRHLHLDLSIGGSFAWALAIGMATAVAGWVMIRRVRVADTDDHEVNVSHVERIFTPMMIFTACAMAFAHGSNDVANGVGPLAAVVAIVRSGGEVASTSGLPIWILGLGGVGIVVGLWTYGRRVMRTIGENITPLTPNRGFCVTLAASATVVLASRTGLPVSTTHIAVGAVVGVGFARAIDQVNLRLFLGIIASWLLTLPLAGGLAALIYLALRSIFVV
ncbi:MAG: phosphate permease [Rhodospirillaceae bacterium]|nr:phosphate permease [Rhodospirillaceae bacterium]